MCRARCKLEGCFDHFKFFFGDNTHAIIGKKMLKYIAIFLSSIENAGSLSTLALFVGIGLLELNASHKRPCLVHNIYTLVSMCGLLLRTINVFVC